jgi:hypothetical protein
MPELRVGAPYIPGKTSFVEGVQYNFRSGEHELLMWLGSPSRAEVDDIRRGQAEFALVVRPPIIFLMYRFGKAITWSDSPYSYWMVPEDQRRVPDTTGMTEPHALLSVILVDAANGLVRGLRAVSFSPAFTTALHLAIAEQAATPWVSQAAYDQALADYYRRYPSSAAMLREASSRTQGGA